MTLPGNEDPTLLFTRMFDASIEAAFDAWLTREQWLSWIGPEGVHCELPELDVRVGGRYRLLMHMQSGQVIVTTGEYRIIDRPNLLVMTWGAENDPARQSLLTLTFMQKGEQTELTLRQEGLGTMPNREIHRAGWQSTINKLAAKLLRDTTRKDAP